MGEYLEYWAQLGQRKGVYVDLQYYVENKGRHRRYVNLETGEELKKCKWCGRHLPSDHDKKKCEDGLNKILNSVKVKVRVRSRAVSYLSFLLFVCQALPAVFLQFLL